MLIDMIIPNNIAEWRLINKMDNGWSNYGWFFNDQHWSTWMNKKHSWITWDQFRPIGTIQNRDAPAQRLGEFPHCVHLQCHSWRSCVQIDATQHGSKKGEHMGKPHHRAHAGTNNTCLSVYNTHLCICKYVYYTTTCIISCIIYTATLPCKLGAANHIAMIHLNGWIGDVTNMPKRIQYNALQSPSIFRWIDAAANPQTAFRLSHVQDIPRKGV